MNRHGLHFFPDSIFITSESIWVTFRVATPPRSAVLRSYRTCLLRSVTPPSSRLPSSASRRLPQRLPTTSGPSPASLNSTPSPKTLRCPTHSPLLQLCRGLENSTLPPCPLARSVILRQVRWSSSKPDESHPNPTGIPPREDARAKLDPVESPSSAHNPLLQRLPSIHRPTKEELLAAATGFWQRLGVRFKWFSIRSGRPFNTDEISAILSWIFLGHLVWVIVGTTTFFSLALLALNTVFAQETLAGWVGNYLTKSSGVKVVFESAIVPKWGDGVISFKNVFVSRRPGQGKANVRKGSSATAAAVAAAARNKDGTPGHITAAGAPSNLSSEEKEDTNYTQFDLSISTVNVTLSFAKWLNGKGLLRDVEIKGVRGVVDRTNVQSGDPNIDPKSYRHQHKTGDFEIDTFKMEDLLVTVHQPGNFRPFSASIFSCELPRLRKQWLFYDIMCANNISGSFDESLFTIHPRQEYSHVSLVNNNSSSSSSRSSSSHDPSSSIGKWKKQSRVRVDGLNIDHLNRGVQGPFSWIVEGNVDIAADIMFPTDDEASIAKVMAEFYDRVEASVTSSGANLHPLSRQNQSVDPSSTGPTVEPRSDMSSLQSNENESTGASPNRREEKDRFLIMDLKVHLNDVRATVPLFNKDLSYVNNALIRPIVAYINAKRAFIPVNCRVVKRVSEFDGSWTVFDSGLLHDLSRETYDAIARDIGDHTARKRRLKKVGLWTLQLAVQAFFIGLAGQLA